MPMFSQLQRARLVDRQGGSARLRDLRVDLSTGDYPTVTHLLYAGPDRSPRALGWQHVSADDWRPGRVLVDALGAGQEESSDRLDGAVLLDRDVMDALVLDLANHQAARANDLWLVVQDGRLLLKGADLSPWAVVRRLGRGLLGSGGDRNLLDWKDVEFLRGNRRAAQAGGDYHRRVERLQPVEIARLVDAMSYVHAAELLTLIPDHVAADALESMGPDRQLQVFEELGEQQAARLLALMAPSMAADLVGRLPPELAQRYLEALPEEQRTRLLVLLQFPPDTAGGIMTNDVIAAPGHLTVGQARIALREQLRAPDFVYYVYVIEDEASARLKGVLTLRDFAIADDDQRLDQVMNPRLVTVDPLESAAVAARRVAERDFAALPVVDRQGQLLGAVTVDAAMAVIAPAWRGEAPRVFS
jgi:CBS domain-containing protein